MLELGLNNTVDFSLQEKTTELGNVTVTATSRIFDSKRTGASTNISNRLIKALPTINRSADDYLRLTPSASANYNGMSFAGRNGQYNNYSLDGQFLITHLVLMHHTGRTNQCSTNITRCN
jgi:hypothetical protein